MTTFQTFQEIINHFGNKSILINKEAKTGKRYTRFSQYSTSNYENEKVAANFNIFDGKGKGNKNVKAITSFSIDLDNDTFLTVSQRNDILKFVKESDINFTYAIHSNGLTLTFILDRAVEATLENWDIITKASTVLGQTIEAQFNDIVTFDNLLMKKDLTMANRMAHTFRVPSFASRRDVFADFIPGNVKTVSMDYLKTYAKKFKKIEENKEETPFELEPTKRQEAKKKKVGSLGPAQVLFGQYVKSYAETKDVSNLRKLGATDKEINKITSYYTAKILKNEGKGAEKGEWVKICNKFGITNLPKVVLDIEPLWEEQRNRQRTFTAIGYVGWLNAYGRYRNLGAKVTWEYLHNSMELRELSKLIKEFWTYEQFELNYFLCTTMFANRFPDQDVSIRAIELVEPYVGMSLRVIAEKTGLSKSTVGRALIAIKKGTGVEITTNPQKQELTVSKGEKNVYDGDDRTINSTGTDLLVSQTDSPTTGSVFLRREISSAMWSSQIREVAGNGSQDSASRDGGVSRRDFNCDLRCRTGRVGFV